MYQGTESLILDHVRRIDNYIHAYVMEPGRGNDYRGRVVIQVHRKRLLHLIPPVYLDETFYRESLYEDDPVSIRVESASGDTLRCMRFLSENPEVVRNAVKAAS